MQSVTMVVMDRRPPHEAADPTVWTGGGYQV